MKFSEEMKFSRSAAPLVTWVWRILGRTVVTIYPFAIVEHGAVIGDDSKVESFCFVENGAVLGARVTLKPGVYVWRGITIGDDVFVGPGVKFTNDSWPRVGKPCPVQKTTVGHGTSIGAGAIILPGAHIPPHSMIAAGATVFYAGGLGAGGLGMGGHAERGRLFDRTGGAHEVERIKYEVKKCPRCSKKGK